MDCLGAWIRIRCGPRAAWIATGDRDDPAVLRSGDRRQHRTDRDPSRAEYAPSDPAAYMSTSSCAPARAIDCVAASITATVRRASFGVTARGSPQARWAARWRENPWSARGER